MKFLVEFCFTIFWLSLFTDLLVTVKFASARNSVRCGKTYQRVPGHSACKTQSSAVVESGVSDGQKKMIVDMHNRYRGQVKPTATNMLKIEWDDEVAKIAQKWADTCNVYHDKERGIPGRYSVGQNLAWGHRNFQHAIFKWYDEKKNFTYGDKKQNFGIIGHYTQVVWAHTKLVGCGYAKCKRTPYYVCNYAPAGNMNDWSRPYIIGPSASACPNHRAGKLCDCGECENDAPRDLRTCACKCKHSFQTGPKCKLSCEASRAKPYWACPEWGVKKCSEWANVPADCPIMCKVCPIDYGR